MRGLARVGVTPNALTVGGFVGNAIAAVLIETGIVTDDEGEFGDVVAARTRTRASFRRGGDPGAVWSLAADGDTIEIPAGVYRDKREVAWALIPLLNQELRDVVETALQRGEQAIILLNRRGTATVVLCRRCGHRITCPSCA